MGSYKSPQSLALLHQLRRAIDAASPRLTEDDLLEIADGIHDVIRARRTALYDRSSTAHAAH